MKKHTEKQPIDDLFARKLGDMSLPPSPAGFERLKARMAVSEPETRVVVWRNPAIQRYMAVAACLLLVSLFGWLYWPSPTRLPVRDQLAKNTPKTTSKVNSGKKQDNQQLEASDVTSTHIDLAPKEPANKLPQIASTIKETNHNRFFEKRSPKANKVLNNSSSVANTEPVLAQAIPTEEKTSAELVSPDKVTPVKAAATEQIADAKTFAKATNSTEHVLEVTIAEPASLVAARQIAKTASEEKQVVAVNDKPDKDPKAGSLWQQVKRLKQGEVFARRDNPVDQDQGLLGRAYNGLKQSFEKDKPAKQ